MHDVSLVDLRAFAAVAQHRSFRRAADAEGVSRSSLSHALTSLEKRLGVRLLHRTTRSVALTEAGEQLLRRLAPMLKDLENMLAMVGQDPDEPAGTLRINANESGARWLLRYAVPAFLSAHPRVTLDLVTEGKLVDIIAEGFDAGIRLAEAIPHDMVAVPFGGDIRFIAVASPSYVKVSGGPVAPDDLKSHRCIRQRLPSGRPYRWEFARGGQEIAVDVPGSLILDDNGLMLEAAIQGLGIAFVPESYAREALADGRLLQVLVEWTPPIPGLCLYYAGHRHVPKILRSFIDVVRNSERATQERDRP